jgi:hypothetical protein
VRGSLESTTEVSDMGDASESDAADMAGWLESRLRLKRGQGHCARGDRMAMGSDASYSRLAGPFYGMKELERHPWTS